MWRSPRSLSAPGLRPAARGTRRARAGRLRQHLAAHDPHLAADLPVRRLRLGEAVVDVRAQRVQRDAALAVPLVARHLGSAEPAGAGDADPLRAELLRGLDRLLHRPPERDAPLELGRDVLRDELRVDLRLTHLDDVQVDLVGREGLEVLLDRLDPRAALADHDPGARGVDVDLDLVRGTLDLDPGDAGLAELLLHELAEVDVLVQPLRVVLLFVPLRVPGADDPEPKPDRMDFLSHERSLLSSGCRYAVPSSTYTWLVFFSTRYARPIARAMKRRIFGPWSTVSVFTNSASTSTRPPFCSAFATAERSSFASGSAAACDVYLSIASASPTLRPRTSSATSRTLRGATRRKRREACGPETGRAGGALRAGAFFSACVASACGAAVFSAAFFFVLVSAMCLPRYFFAAGAGAAALATFFSAEWPWKVRVGANSPSLWPTMFSVTNTGTNFRPLCTARVWPTKSGRMVLRRDQVLMTDFLLPLFASSTFLVRCLSANGPFLIERAMARSLRRYCGVLRTPGRRRVTMNLSVRRLLRVFKPFVFWPHGLTGCGLPCPDLPSPPPGGWSTGFMARPRTVGRMPSHRLFPALPTRTLELSTFESWPIVALHPSAICRTSPDGMRSWAYPPSFAMSWPKEPADRIILPPEPGCDSTLWTTVPSGIERIGRVCPGRMSTDSPERSMSPTATPTGARM